MLRKRIYLCFWLLLLLLTVYGQNLHERVWFFGGGYSMQFVNGVAQPGGVPPPAIPGLYNNTGNGTNLFQIAASDAAGNLAFLVQIKSYFQNPNLTNYVNNGYKVFDRQGNPFPHGNIFTNGYSIATDNVGAPIVVPYPGNPNKYLLFYCLDNSLRYSVIDMSLHNGYGDIDPAQKDIQLTGYNEIIGYKMTTVRGCNHTIWLVAKSATDNNYLSFRINSEGIDTIPVLSPVATLPTGAYKVTDHKPGGLLNASNNNLLLAAATEGGIELYDFEPCSGRLKNPRIIDTLKAYGICFSPDDTKLYVSHNIPFWTVLTQGEIYQYDLSSGQPAVIAASRTLVMRNPVYMIVGVLTIPHTGPFGAIKPGLDGRLYISKNSDFELSPQAPPGSAYYYLDDPDHVPVPYDPSLPIEQGQYMQVINNPDNAGAACNAQLDYLKIGDLHFPPYMFLQNEIRAASDIPPDTVQGNIIDTRVCFANSAVLTAANGACYIWDNGATEQQCTVYGSGIYWVRYHRDCTVQTDTFRVTFVPLPGVPQLVYGCEGQGSIHIQQPDSFEGSYNYTLYNADNALVGTAASSSGYSFGGLNAGNYSLNIITALCDTTLPITIAAYPTAHITATPADTTIHYGDTILLQVSGGIQYVWSPNSSLSNSTIAAPLASPLNSVVYTVVGFNEYGCTDTGYVKVGIDYAMPVALPNAFSPNGDGLNDVFKIVGITYQKITAFQIFNRWGEMIFSTINPEAGWDGTYKGRPCDAGAYHYYVRIIRPDGLAQTFKGDITLIR